MAAIGVGSTGSWREASSIMRKPPPDYTALEHEAWKQNASQVVARLDEDEPNLLKRIATFVRRFGFHVHEVRQKILSDPMFRAHFAIEPRRQGFHEKIASKWIRSLPDISDFRVLPKSGRNAFYITSDGEVRQGLRKPPSKSLDFTWQADGRQFYAAHKYTLEGGGNQSAWRASRGSLRRDVLRQGGTDDSTGSDTRTKSLDGRFTMCGAGRCLPPTRTMSWRPRRSSSSAAS